ncbi:putative threonine aldolase [Xylariaceae sp. FL0255]|nr:putative threonine aldolase [Xylariaceae sp. FL0255]
MSSEETMAKYSFNNDYSEGAHPKIIEALTLTNLSQQKAYGFDEYCEKARTSIRKLIGDADNKAEIYFSPGGTGANLLAIAGHLRPHEAIISADSGHIVSKEGGAIEATGHQVLSAPGVDGKLTPEIIQRLYSESVKFPFQPKPKMVFVANATELGTVYTKAELSSIATVCKTLNLLLLLDGARLGAALASEKNDMSFKDIYDLTDVFWIGGTKNGALLGEAVVIKDPTFGADFPFHMKQRGQLLAKGRVIGVQFSTLFDEDGDLFLSLARHANAMATEISIALVKSGFSLWAGTESNQIFPILPPTLVQQLQKDFEFFVWYRMPNGFLVVRLLTSWATEHAQVIRFCMIIEKWAHAHK